MIIAREHIKRPKPSPEIYYQCCLATGLSTKQVLIFDSSAEGKKAALASGCHLYSGKSFNYDSIKHQIELIDEVAVSNPVITTWQKNVQVIVPLIDTGDAFLNAGFGYPTPLVEVDGDVMLQKMVKNLNLSASFVFVVSTEMFEKYKLKYFLETLDDTGNSKVVFLDEKTPTICQQVLAAGEVLKLDEPVMVAFCSQILEWDSNAFLYCLENPSVDGGVLTFSNQHPRYAYVGLDERGWVIEAELNKAISANACAGIFHFKKARNLVKYASTVLVRNEDSTDKFAVIKIFKEAIKDGKKIRNFQCRRMWELSSPKDVDYYNMIQKTDA